MSDKPKLKRLVIGRRGFQALAKEKTIGREQRKAKCDASHLFSCLFPAETECALCGMKLCKLHAKWHSCEPVKWAHRPDCQCDECLWEKEDQQN
jgi:hypothetical protein